MDKQHHVETAVCMILLLRDAIISLGFDKMSTVMCMEHKHLLSHQHALEIFPEENPSSHSEASPVFGLLLMFRLLADYAHEVALKAHESFCLLIIINGSF